MQTQHYIPGLPRRMGAALSAMWQRDGYSAHPEKWEVVSAIQSGAGFPIPFNADENELLQAADAAARQCYGYADRYRMADAIEDGVRLLANRLGVEQPQGDTAAEVIARGVDKGWWARQIRRAHARRFEHSAIRLGFTNYRAGAYLSNESAIRQLKRNRQNAKLLQSIQLQNQQTGQVYSLADLAALGVANKAIRRGELMTRIRGFEEIAKDFGHVGFFVTLTAPSKYHAVSSVKGTANPRYVEAGSPTPRDAQRYLCGVWACIRSALDRAGIEMYGFRIAEPHHDGCPHWHLLLFVDPSQLRQAEGIFRHYALAEDGEEPGAQKNRIKIVNIEAGKGGSAAGYIAKYVAKNIDGHALDGQTVTENGKTYVVLPDILGNEEIIPAQRVSLWAQTWGIRQFQQIGGAPVGVWRELRRVERETVAHASETVQAAWRAAQRNGDEQASFAGYLRAQGGPVVGRRGWVQLAKRETEIKGKYATYTEAKPCGVYDARHAAFIYESVRYQWEQVGAKSDGVAVPWTGVNNCTRETIDGLLLMENGEKRAVLLPVGGEKKPLRFEKTLPELEKNKFFAAGDYSAAIDPEKVRLRPDAEQFETFLRHKKHKENWHLDALRRKYGSDA